ncbi:MAG: hypothetical protein HC778_04925 [Chamaesiphon sp. CSU_1_12]|nr:hypothetical protein [Chamaesiphon sp. CSU_1_12]
MEAVRPFYEADIQLLLNPRKIIRSQNPVDETMNHNKIRNDLRWDQRLLSKYRRDNFNLNEGRGKSTIGTGELITESGLKEYRSFSGPQDLPEYSPRLPDENRHLPSEALGKGDRKIDAEPKILERALLDTNPNTRGKLILSVSRETCSSCDYYGIPRFQWLRPGIEIEIRNP